MLPGVNSPSPARQKGSQPVSRFTPKPADQQIVVKMTMGSARVAHDTCLNAWHSLGCYKLSLEEEGIESRSVEEVRGRLLELAHWFAQLRVDKPRKEVQQL